MTRRRLALGLWLFAVGVTIATLIVDAMVNQWENTGRLLAFFLVPTGIVGLLVARREPRNPIGWMLLGVLMLGAAYGAVGSYATLALKTHPGALPGGVYAVWLLRWMASPIVIMLGPILFLLFPTGRPHSSRWRPVQWISVALAVLGMVVGALSSGQLLDTFPGIRNPFGVLEPTAFYALDSLALASTTALGLASLIARYRLARGIERQQVKVFLFAAAVVAALGLSLVLPAITGGSTGFLWFLFVVAQMFMPVSIGIAILRYRLYDIDIVINRTLVYGAVMAALAATYLAAVVLLQTLLRPFTPGSELSVAGSTLTVVALFHPLRRRIQETVDRRFYRSRYNAARTLETFGTRLRDEVDLDALKRELLTVTRETMQPAHASLWLRGAR